MKKKWFPLWVIPLVIGMAIGTVWLRLYLVRTTYAIDQAEREIRSMRQVREQMELKVTGFRSPRRLEALARAKFNLTQPRADQIINMSRFQQAKAPRER
jgi:hypothetical protein